MKRRIVFFAMAILCAGAAVRGQVSVDTLGVHDLTPTGSAPLTGQLSASCLYCHAPHSGAGGMTPLWNQALSKQTYTPYSSSTYQQTGSPQPTVGGPSSLCLSCHDGTVAPGVTVAYGTFGMNGFMAGADRFGTNLQGSHPFSMVLPLKDQPDLAASIVAQSSTLDGTGAVHMVNGNVECSSCHQAHVQRLDPNNPMFLVRDSSRGQMCLACHDPNRTMNGQVNPLAGWATSIHATSANATTLQAGVGPYGTITQNACAGCHAMHNAGSPARLLRASNEQDCLACHIGGTNISPPTMNVFAEFSKTAHHPFPTAGNQHDATEPAVLNQNRHATCVDCHNPHASQPVSVFSPAPGIRPSQAGVTGVSATDGISAVNPAINQYENCLRCHGTSAGKTTNSSFGYSAVWLVSAPDALNEIPQFSITATSSHPVMHDRNSPLPQPSLRANMLNLDLTPGRAMGTRILCTDCHNSDDNREFGGSGTSGPHGSSHPHILERKYVMSQAHVPGGTITNLNPNPDLGLAGPYALCNKCHDLGNIMTNASFSAHSAHLNDGFSCSACHTGHGMGGTSATVSGERLVNFDLNVVAPNGNAPISYNRATNTCTLLCHNVAHDSSTGHVRSPAGIRR
ncbi:MAG: hypothetical protein JO041_12495 [Acidobacteria bacterium]|nr:hypothetical protein [Acidobacteriota bacterium]